MHRDSRTSETDVAASDTTPEAREVLLRLARTMSVAQKAAVTGAMSRTVRQLAEAGVRSRHPAADEAEVRKRVAAVLLPRELVIALFAWDPQAEGY